MILGWLAMDRKIWIFDAPELKIEAGMHRLYLEVNKPWNIANHAIDVIF